jgi:Ca2+-binding RTX toxin-like protein
MAYLTYEDARAAAERAPHGDWDLPTYRGSKTDLSYLKNYVIANAAAMYDVPTSVFKTATVFSTTLVRDFIHRAVYSNTDSGYYKDLNLPPMRTDVAAALRYPASDSCGLMGYQLWKAYQALGYEATRYDGLDGDYLSPKSQWSYKLSHVITEVYLQDLGKYALQCSTFNAMFTDKSGTLLSSQELRAAHANGDFNIEHTDVYLRYREWGLTVAELAGKYEYYRDYVRNSLAGGWEQVTFAFEAPIRPFTLELMRIGHSSLTREGAIEKLAQAQTMRSWTAAADFVDEPVTGFKTYSLDTGRATGEWLTIRLANGSYISRDGITGTVLNGSLDQLMNEATGEDRVLNPGKNLSALLQPLAFLTAGHQVFYDLAIRPYQKEIESKAGTAGANSLSANGGTKLLIGLGGNDVYYVDGAHDRVLERSGGGTVDRVFTSVSYSLSPATQVECLAAVSPTAKSAINLTGNKFANMLAGNNGNNLLNGGLGPDKMFGRDGNDTYFVDRSTDVVNEHAGNGYDKVYANVTYRISSSTEVEFLTVMSSTSTKAVNLYGNKYNNTLVGNAGVNKLDGGTGTDTMKGLGSNDVYIVDRSSDKVIETVGGGSRDVLYAKADYRLTAGVEVEVLRAVAGTQPIDLTGNGFNQILVGNPGANILLGGGGNDTLIGSGGADTLRGNDGDDIFYFTVVPSAANVATIVDFNVADDMVWLSSIKFGLTKGALSGSAFELGTAASSASARLIYDDTSGRLYFDADGNGGTANPVGIARLVAIPNLGVGDFFVV